MSSSFYSVLFVFPCRVSPPDFYWFVIRLNLVPLAIFGVCELDLGGSVYLDISIQFINVVNDVILYVTEELTTLTL